MAKEPENYSMHKFFITFFASFSLFTLGYPIIIGRAYGFIKPVDIKMTPTPKGGWEFTYIRMPEVEISPSEETNMVDKILPIFDLSVGFQTKPINSKGRIVMGFQQSQRVKSGRFSASFRQAALARRRTVRVLSNSTPVFQTVQIQATKTSISKFLKKHQTFETGASLISVNFPQNLNTNGAEPIFFDGSELLSLNGIEYFDGVLEKTDTTNVIDHQPLPNADLSITDQDYLTNLNSIKRESNAFLTNRYLGKTEPLGSSILPLVLSIPPPFLLTIALLLFLVLVFFVYTLGSPFQV